MHKTKIDKLSELLNSNGFLSTTFVDILDNSQSKEIIEDLVFVIGYNYIDLTEQNNGDIIITAGVVPEDLREVLTVRNKNLDGKLSERVETTFNTLLDIKRQSNILELYPREMRKSINEEIMKKNNIDSCFFNQIKLRAIC
ncbi:hypothetical protein [Vibrio anguillarum]|nr:hypothetical protein [Vibrio anguillarum]MBF4232616.1 hypothetical protein [Vibrio anguillarum]MBF4254100.1 hypothetical protein [Vibrio anguillarum]MBF4282780.1 hypothetical protein [Vibrio anguillarum]MBF4288851.1 hypothetical protein [Vibrio anguillarum]MBF4356131.1 hypothetical protein [Vibrio anguillarum]